jgi:hypothetical protein
MLTRGQGSSPAPFKTHMDKACATTNDTNAQREAQGTALAQQLTACSLLRSSKPETLMVPAAVGVYT